MANDLSNLDITKPEETKSISEGDDRIRETREHLVNWAGIEHALTGEHKFPHGSPAAKPAAGNSGRLWIDTSNRRLELDDGSIWRALGVIGSGVAFSSSPTTLTGSYQTIASLSVEVPEASRVVLLGMAMYYASTAARKVSVKLLVGGVLLGAICSMNVAEAEYIVSPIFNMTANKAAGTYSLALQALSIPAGGIADNKTLIALVI